MTTIHNVIILDKSGSMADKAGGKTTKYNVAVAGIKEEMTALKKDTNAFYTQTIIEFSSYDTVTSNIKEHCFMLPLINVHSFEGVGPGGGTPLFQTIGETIEKLLRYVNKGEKVLLKIFTDGEENTSSGKYSATNVDNLKRLISQVTEENGFVVTFEGTKEDCLNVHRQTGINMDNMHFHDNTLESISKGVKMRTSSTYAYSAGLAKGVDYSNNFYNNADAQANAADGI